MTPSFIGRTAITPSGVRPSMRLASSPTPLILPVARSIATTDGSFKTIPSPLTYTSVFAVPRSTAIAFAGNKDPALKKGQRISGRDFRPLRDDGCDEEGTARSRGKLVPYAPSGKALP